MMVNDYYNEKFVGVELKRLHDKNPCHTTILPRPPIKDVSLYALYIIA